VVGDLDSKGVRGLEFVILDGTASAAFVTAEENSSSNLKMGCLTQFEQLQVLAVSFWLREPKSFSPLI